MMQLRRLSPVLRSAGTWIALSVLAPLGMLVVSGMMLLDLRRDAWDKAEQTSRNLLQVIERDIARNVEIFDLSINAVVENLRTPGLETLDPRMRQLVLFDRAATARDMGVMLVLNDRGEIIDDAGAMPPRKGNYADREYFQAQRLRADRGVYIGRPIVSRLTGEPMLPFSRRVSKPDGSFGGVVLGSLKLSYFTRLFDQIGLGREGAINLYLRDGTRVMRYPYEAADIGVNIAGAPTFMRFASARNGSFVDVSVRDGVERYYTFTQVGDLPLILNVALSTRDVEAEWRTKALGIGIVLLILCGLTVALSLLFGKELRRRTLMQAEFSRLSETDTLTGLANRRRFDEAFSYACAQVARSGKPLSLLMIDADHFKRFNDHYGHEVGDAVLKGLARCLGASVHRPSDLVCRVGGEEFALLLPDTDAAGAFRVAGAVHAQIATLVVEAAGIGPGGITVSIGLATGTADARNLYTRADTALYEAKAGGRNQTRCVPSIGPQSLDKPSLRLVER
ncbi:sensor domain-containing diguanylate cyclase [Methylobacterium sp. E-045]|uniref:sensor domain-containing diguanylate cyclase n=1 Tax=Methylobacterium sp. E-045 TaxID=2836575 RepID=UPI001FB9727E|nr:sensor domain-containing diguanylate cyclase [Methylobacterium sp. E-045]MCJ2128684.1 sensor domain-containing diguanylate cyclase [Methylobacterium sp. E-045]